MEWRELLDILKGAGGMEAGGGRGYVRCCLVIGIQLTRDSRRFREADMISSQLFSISLPSP